VEIYYGVTLATETWISFPYQDLYWWWCFNRRWYCCDW